MQAGEGIARQNLEATNLEKHVPDGLAAKVNKQTGSAEGDELGFGVATGLRGRSAEFGAVAKSFRLVKCQQTYITVSQHKQKMIS